MDLFGDLPEPESSSSKEIKKIGDKRSSNDDNGLIDEDEKKRKLSEEISTFQCTGKYKLKGFVAGQKGERDEMQDAHNVVDDFTKDFKTLHTTVSRLALYCVYDGHGGSRASKFTAKQLPLYLQDRFPKGDVSLVEKEVKKVFIDTFKKIDEEFLSSASKSKPSWKDGSTAVCVLVINDTLFIANLGDSKAILCRYNRNSKKYTPIPLTTDHSPSLYEERMRIQKCGGTVREGRVMGVLEVSRSIGDGPYKNHGVTCLPDIKRCQITDDDRYLMVACDGLWKSFTMEESIQYVNKILDCKEVSSNNNEVFETACHKLTSEAVLRLSGDNVTVILTSINKYS